jgi:hypothetical protein
MDFFKRYTGAWVTSAVIAVVGFLAISSSEQYGSLSSRVWNGVGAGFTFGAIAFTLGWAATKAGRAVRPRKHGESSHASRATSSADAALPVDAAEPSARPQHDFANLAPPRDEAGGIFISYRRDDEPSFAGRLYDRLSQEFGARHVFMDVDSIEPGLDFVHVINDALSRCEALLAIVGPEWLTATDPQGRPRLQNSSDYVRLEIEAALTRNVRVIPILVDGAQMPAAVDLPPTLRLFSRRNGLQMSYSRFRGDVESLVGLLRQIVNRVQPPGL